jgi:5-methylcytosine-specific restriction endonuclease McrA
MSRWFRIDSEMFRSADVMRMSAKQFRVEFAKAINGVPSALDAFVRGPYTRPLSHEWAELRAAVFERDSYTCTYCGAHGVRLECDHVVPVCKGGTSALENLTTACKPCNRAKAGKTLAEWKA